MSSLGLLDLSVELRFEIYDYLFKDTVVRYGDEDPDENLPPRNQHPLALLATSQVIRAEALEYVFSNIVLDFGTTGQLLRTLLPMSPSQRGRFRYARVRYTGPTNPLVSYTSFDIALQMLKGLKLDTLMLRDSFHDGPDEGADDGNWIGDLEALIEIYGIRAWTLGWKRLLFHSPSSRTPLWWFPSNEFGDHFPNFADLQWRKSHERPFGAQARIFWGERQQSDYSPSLLARGDPDQKAWREVFDDATIRRLRIEGGNPSVAKPILVELRRADGDAYEVTGEDM